MSTTREVSDNHSDALSDNPAGGIASNTFDVKLAACRGETDAMFVGAGEDTGPAVAMCAECPVREACLLEAVLRCEGFGVWGGAGEQRRRKLRRAFHEGRYTEVVAAHFRQIDGTEAHGDRELLAVWGEGATHGRRVTYAKACRCSACSMAAAFETTLETMRQHAGRRSVKR